MRIILKPYEGENPEIEGGLLININFVEESTSPKEETSRICPDNPVKPVDGYTVNKLFVCVLINPVPL